MSAEREHRRWRELLQTQRREVLDCLQRQVDGAIHRKQMAASDEGAGLAELDAEAFYAALIELEER